MSRFTKAYVTTVTKQHAINRVQQSISKTIERMKNEPNIGIEGVQTLHELTQFADHISAFRFRGDS